MMKYRCINDPFCYCDTTPKGIKREDLVEPALSTFPFYPSSCTQDNKKCKHKKTQSEINPIERKEGE